MPLPDIDPSNRKKPHHDALTACHTARHDGQRLDALILLATRRRLQAPLEEEVHLLHEPMSQADLDRLYALYDHWQATLGHSPEAIALSDALDDFISACIEAGQGGDPRVEQAYLALLQSVQEGGA